MLISRFVYLVGVIDKELRIALDSKTLHSQGSSGLQARYQSLVLCYIVGDLLALLETELHVIVELVLGGRYEHRPSPSTLPGECSIEVHDPAFWRLVSWGKGPILAGPEARCLCPFGHEICQRGPLDDSG